jgi:Na+-transporting methylmalonyl-CoA/oxaloacetate decarboxylase gamma subunit
MLFGVLALLLCGISRAETQPQNINCDSIINVLLVKIPDEAYDPLIPQAFVFDKNSNVFGVINQVDNSIDIIGFDGSELRRINQILVDHFTGRHDVHHIYRPQGIAIYENHLVYLASHRDSCFLSILDLQGNEIKRVYFKGNAMAFSYSKEAQQLFIAGQNNLGYDLIAISTKQGIENISDKVDLHYQKPKKDEEIKKYDAWGVGITVIAMSTVFLALLMLTIIFSSTAKVLRVTQKLLRKKEKGIVVAPVPVAKHKEEISGEEYAAIATAIYMYDNELHDEENTVLTIEKTTRSWTPWNAKYFNMNTYFMKKGR